MRSIRSSGTRSRSTACWHIWAVRRWPPPAQSMPSPPGGKITLSLACAEEAVSYREINAMFQKMTLQRSLDEPERAENFRDVKRGTVRRLPDDRLVIAPCSL